MANKQTAFFRLVLVIRTIALTIATPRVGNTPTTHSVVRTL